MSLSLHLLADRYVFESSPTRHDLGALHVPFDELTQPGQTEARLDAAVRRREPVALIGASGSGKSSVIAHMLGPLAEGVAPLFVPLAAMPAETIDTPVHLADHLLSTITRLAGSAAARIEADLAPGTTMITRTRRVGGGLGWGWMRGEMARQVTHQTKLEARATLLDKTDALAQVLEIVSAEGLRPVLVFDDTDRWLRNGGTKLVESFFGEGVRWMLELPAALVVAAHPHYFETTPRDRLLQYLDTRITIPQLPTTAAIDAILRRRIERYAGVTDPDLPEVIAPDASAAILGVYREAGSLRRALQVCHTALHEALSDGAPRLTARHIQAAANAG